MRRRGVAARQVTNTEKRAPARVHQRRHAKVELRFLGAVKFLAKVESQDARGGVRLRPGCFVDAELRVLHPLDHGRGAVALN